MKLKETELFHPVKLFLEKNFFCEVHGEVSGYDVVGIGKGYEVIVELKTGMSLQFLDQMMERVGKADYVFSAIPKKKTHISRSAIAFLKSLGIGLMEVDLNVYKNIRTFQKHYNEIDGEFESYGVRILHWGKRFNPKYRLKQRVNHHTRHSIGGSTTSEMNTPYKITMRNIKRFLRTYYHDDGWATVDDILEGVQTHYSNPKPSVMATLQEEWNKNWIETKKIGKKRYFRLKHGH